MRTVFLTNSLDGGGAETSIFNMAEILARKYPEIHLIGLNQSFSKSNKSSNWMTTINRNLGSGVLATFKVYKQYRSLISKLNPDVIVLNCELPELFGAFTFRKRIKLIAVEHTSNPWNNRKILGLFIRAILLVKRTKWITVNSSQKRIWPYQQKSSYIPNPIVIPSKIKQITGDELRFVFIGRLRPEKQPQMFIEAVWKEDVNGIVIGDGLMIDELRKLHNSEKIQFTGYLDNPWSKLSANDVVVVPSDFEGDGKVAVEAIILGQPILLRNNSDLKRFNLPSTNYFHDVNELRDKIRDIQKGNLATYRPSQSLRNTLREERNIYRITSLWENKIQEI